ncbi:MAG: PEGA domain-containing protein [Methylococcaceae bacterium]
MNGRIETPCKWTVSAARIVETALLPLIVCTMCGCTSITTRSDVATETRNWTIPYQEDVEIRTEPDGASLYCNEEYLGASPKTVRVSVGSITMHQTGTYPIMYDANMNYNFLQNGPTVGEVAGTRRRTGPTTWNSAIFDTVQGSYTVKAVKQGYEPSTRDINLTGYDAVFQSACVSESSILGHRPMLLVLNAKTVHAQPVQQPQLQQQQQTVVIGGGSRNTAKQIGTVNVTASVDGADVTVDGLFVGNAPATLKLTEGVHVIEVTKEGGGTYKSEIRVLGDAETTLLAILK